MQSRSLGTVYKQLPLRPCAPSLTGRYTEENPSEM